MSVITWVTDPYLPSNTQIQTRVQAILQSFKPMMSTLTVLERTITRYIYFFSQVVEYPPDLAKLVYTPATLGFQSAITIPGESLGELITIVKTLTTQIFRIRVDSVQTDIYIDPADDRNLIYLFQPLLATGNPIYRPIEELAEFLSIPLGDLVGWKVLSADPLTSYLLKKPEYSRLTPIEINGVYLLNIYKTLDLAQVVEQFRQELYFLNLKGYFVVENIPPELISSFELVTHGPNIYSNSEGIFTAAWLKKATENLRRGLLPSLLIAGSWQMKNWPPGDEAKLVLSLILSYFQLTQTYPELIPYLPLVGVTRGLDLRVNLSSKRQMKNLIDSFMKWLETTPKWKVHPVDSLRQGVALRIFYQRKRVYPPSLIVNRRGRYFVVIAVSESQLLPEIDDELKKIYQELPEEIPYDLSSAGLISGYGASGILGDQYINRPIVLPTLPARLPERVEVPSLPSPVIRSPRREPLRERPLLMEPGVELPPILFPTREREQVRVRRYK